MAAKKRPAYEIVIIVAVVLLSVILSAGLYAGRAKVEKGDLIVKELSMFRSAVALYRMKNGSFPPSLETLTKETYKEDGNERPFLDRLPTSDDGRLRDPFGGSYAYDAKTGWVQSTSPGYDKW